MSVVAAAMVRGWCPGVLRPMESGDGLIVRLRIGSGIVPVALAARIAEWSRGWGNGQIDLSNRANLQLRGVLPHHLPRLHKALAEWGLLDSSEAGEAVRNVTCSPLAGLDPEAVLDIRPVAGALERHLAHETALHDLPGKFGFALDDGGSCGIGDVPADVRFMAFTSHNGSAFEVHLDGAPLSCLGPCGSDTVVGVADALARLFLRHRLGQEARIRRMRDLVAVLGIQAIAHEAGLVQSGSQIPVRQPRPAVYLGVRGLGAGAFLGIGLPFGRIAAEDLARVAAVATANGARELRLTPWRAILLPVASVSVARILLSGLAGSSLIVDPEDARCRIVACPGAPSCPRGTTPVHGDANRLATELGHAPGTGTFLHVSGCEKGCAHPKPAPVTLVAQNGRYDLVRNGAASDVPVLRGLTMQQVRNIILTDQPRGNSV